MMLEIQKTDEGFRLIGELDLAAEQDLGAELEPALERGGDIVLDLAELEFIDSSGVRGIIRAADRLDSGGRIVLRNPADPVKRVFELMRLDTIPNVEVRTAET